jgi:hypothetical protein
MNAESYNDMYYPQTNKPTPGFASCLLYAKQYNVYAYHKQEKQ